MDTTLFAVALLNNVQMYSQEKKKLLLIIVLFPNFNEAPQGHRDA